jgi:DNA repair ATPase RecN
MESEKAFKEFEQIIDRLGRLSDDLVEIIDKQISAVVSSNGEDVEQYVEEYTHLRGVFKEQEHKFIDHLQMMLNNAGVKSIEIRLENLKEAYPETADTISDWQEELEKQMKMLKAKHQKLNNLLEFAVEKNMQLMHSIYSLHNKKNTRYSAGGSKEEISSGIALNKEA